MKRTVKFERVTGGWRFTWGHNTYMALLNEAGFGGRAWELWEARVPNPAYGMANDEWRRVADMLATRKECVDVAVKKYERVR